MMAIWAHHAEQPDLYGALSDFASTRIFGKPKPFGSGTAMGVVDGAKVVSSVVFYDYDADAGVIQISAAADTPRWLTRQILKEMFGYPFNGLGCQAVVMRVDPDNTRLARILHAYGFTSHTVPHLRGKNKAECLFVLSSDDWRENGFHKEVA